MNCQPLWPYGADHAAGFQLQDDAVVVGVVVGNHVVAFVVNAVGTQVVAQFRLQVLMDAEQRVGRSGLAGHQLALWRQRRMAGLQVRALLHKSIGSKGCREEYCKPNGQILCCLLHEFQNYFVFLPPL